MWIKVIFHSTKIAVLINGSPTKEFAPSRGLRQGDPLSPLLFNIVGQILHHLITEANIQGKFEGVHIGHDAYNLTHLQFADDTLLFINGDDNSIHSIKRILIIFQLLSGLKINFHKSELYALNYAQHQKEKWAHTLGCNLGSWPLKYLGVPLGLSQTSSSLWDPLLSKFHKNLNGWAKNHINTAGKLVLLKATLDSLPIYWFNFFRLPTGIRNKIDTIRRNFLWGTNKIHLTNWKAVSLSKGKGGLGITNLEHRNLAMLGKVWWRILENNNKPWMRLLRAKYGIDYHNWTSSRYSNKPSTLIRNLQFLQGHRGTSMLFNRDSYKWKANNGSRTRFWEDTWTADNSLQFLFPRLYRITRHKNIYIKDL